MPKPSRASSPRATGVVLAWDDELLLGSRFTHRIDARGVATEVVLAGGRRLDSATLSGLACRLTHLLPLQFATAAEADRDYAAMESQALLLSWLASLRCPVLNRASPRGLAGPVLGALEWSALAAASGLRARRIRTGGREELEAEPVEDPTRILLVVGERVLGDVREDEAAACVSLSRRVGCPVLGVELAGPRGSGPALFCGAEVVPRLGAEGAAAVAELLTGGQL
jgi:hypothetical protein